MDVEYPYAEGLSRRQLLYRLPPTPQPRRLLLVSATADDELIAGGWGGPVTVVPIASLGAALASGEAQFDAVAIPSALGQPAAAHLLGAAQRLLVPGGVVIGHVENLRTLRSLVSVRGWGRMLGDMVRGGAMGSAARSKDSLLRAGYIEPECYYVQPSIDSPMGLIPCASRPARAQFLRTIRSAQGHYSHWSYGARLLVASVGLGGMQQPQLFFWARRPC